MADAALPNDPDPEREPPSYDADMEGYVGVSSGAIAGIEGVRDARAFAEMVVDTVREGLLVLDLDLRVVAANESFYRTFKVKPEDTVGRLVYDLGDGQWDVPELRELLDDVLPQKKAFDDYEVEHEFEGLGRRCMVLNGRWLNDHRLVLLAIEDVTDRRRAELVLQASETRQTFLLRLSDALRAERDADAIAVRALRMLYEHVGLDRCYVGVFRLEEDLGVFPHQVGNDRVPALPDRVRLSDFPDALRIALDRTLVIDDIAGAENLNDTDRQNLDALGMRALVASSLREGEKNPVWSIVAVAAQPREWTQGEIALIDETTERTWAAVERDRTERALRESEAKYRELFEAIDEGFSVVEMVYDEGGDPVDYRFLEVNPAFERQTGLEGALGRTIRELIPDIEPSWIEAYGRVAKTGEPAHFFDHVESMGRWYEVSAFRRGGPDERRVAVLFFDVTEEKRAEAALRASEARFREMAETVPDALFTAAPDGRVDYVSGQIRAFTGVPPEDVVGTGLWPDLVHPDDRSRVRAEWVGAVRDRRQFEARHRLRHAGDGYRWVVVRARPVYGEAVSGEGGAAARWFGVVSDVDALVRSEEEVRALNRTLEGRIKKRTVQVRELARALTLAEQAERKRIAYLLHDDLQQRLYGLGITLSLLGRHAEGGEAERLRAQAVETLDRATALTRTLAHELSPALLEGDDLADLLEWVAGRKREALGLDVAVEVRGRVSVPEEEVRVLLYQIVRELLFNVAKHAGTKRVRVTAEEDGDEVRVTVEDEGAGFDVAETADGDGLGLPSVRERLALVGGRLDVESAPGEGTRVTITVPRGGQGD